MSRQSTAQPLAPRLVARSRAFTLALGGLLLVALGTQTGCSSARAREAQAGSTLAGGTLSLKGTSTMHGWECLSKSVDVTLTPATGRSQAATPTEIGELIRDKGFAGLDVKIPVTSLHSDKKGLDKNMLKALSSDAHPRIEFRMLKYTASPVGSSDTLALRIEGTLTVAGVSKPVTLSARAWQGEKGEWVEGSAPINMTDYGIKPPRMFLGALRVADRVDIHYRLLLTPDPGTVGLQAPSNPNAEASDAG